MSKKKRKRNIPKNISDAVKQRHFFECAWCGLKIFERHHIKEFHLGGEHEEENLILLCPNHHRMAHTGEINSNELKERKSTHIKGDRLTGDFKTSVENLKVNMCSGTAINTPNLLTHNDYPILKIYLKNNNILIDAKFYNRAGALVFWMSRNMFWSHTNAEISSPKVDFLEIKNSNESIYLKVEKSKIDDSLNVEMSTYLDGNLIKFEKEKAVLPNGGIIQGGQILDSWGYINYQTKPRNN